MKYIHWRKQNEEMSSSGKKQTNKKLSDLTQALEKSLFIQQTWAWEDSNLLGQDIK